MPEALMAPPYGDDLSLSYDKSLLRLDMQSLSYLLANIRDLC